MRYGRTGIYNDGRTVRTAADFEARDRACEGQRARQAGVPWPPPHLSCDGGGTTAVIGACRVCGMDTDRDLLPPHCDRRKLEQGR